jgi:hypothetical protein
MELVKVKDEMGNRIVDKAKKLYDLNPTEWSILVSDEAKKIIDTMRSYMRMGYFPKKKFQVRTGKDGRKFVRFAELN